MMSYLIYILLSMLLFVACDSSHDEGWDEYARVLPIDIRIKTTEVPQQRALGDPGVKEEFPLPRMAYIYVLANSETDGTGASLLQMVSGANSQGGIALEPTWWAQDGSDPSIYHYTGPLNIKLWHLTQSAKVYVAVSDREIPGIQLPSNPDEIVSLKYALSQIGEASSEFMKNLYATPYNLNKSDGAYYGTVIDLNTNTPSVNVMLYHVAARLDIKWNVEDERRQSFALGALSVNNLPKQCYLFQPTLNNVPADANAYSESIVSSFSPTTAWSGRKVVYVPQVNDGSKNFPVRLHYTNAADNNAAGTKEQAFQFESDVFTTWFNVEANFVNN